MHLHNYVYRSWRKKKKERNIEIRRIPGKYKSADNYVGRPNYAIYLCRILCCLEKCNWMIQQKWRDRWPTRYVSFPAISTLRLSVRIDLVILIFDHLTDSASLKFMCLHVIYTVYTLLRLPSLRYVDLVSHNTDLDLLTVQVLGVRVGWRRYEQIPFTPFTSYYACCGWALWDFVTLTFDVVTLKLHQDWN